MDNSTQVVHCMWPDKPEQCNIVRALMRTFSALSLIGCLFVVMVIWLFRTYRYFIQRLILSLSVSAALKSFSFMLGDIYENVNMCQFQAFLLQYFSWSTLLWVFCLTVNIMLVLHGCSNPEKMEKWYHCLCWISSIFWAALPFIGNSYGPAGVWCWIKRDATGFRFGVWYVPFFLIIIFLVVSYMYFIWTALKSSERWSGTYNAETQYNNAMLAKDVKPLAAFPLIYIILSIPTIIYRVDDAVRPHELPSYILMIVNVIFVPLSGALNAIAFAFYGEIYSFLTWGQIKSAIRSRCSKDTTRVTHNYDVNEIVVEDDEFNDEIVS